MGESPKTSRLVLRLFGVQLVVIIISVLFMESFVGMISSVVGIKIYSTITAAIYLCVYYSKVWKAADKDRKLIKLHNDHHDEKISPKRLKGLYAGLLAAVPNICMLIAVAVTGATKSSLYSVFNPIYRILMTPFIGWLGNDNLTYIPNCIIITLIPVVLGIFAYLAGLKNFSVIEKYLPILVYKNDKPENKHE